MYRTISRVVVATAVVAALAGCTRHHLDEYHFTNKRLALVFIERPNPELLHGWFTVRPSQNAIQTVFRAGASVAKEIEARKAMVRFDSAARTINYRERLAAPTLERVSRYLGTHAVATEDSADFVLEITMRGFGLDARSNNATYAFASAEAVLLDRDTGREIWHYTAHGREQLTAWVYGGGVVPSAGISAITLSTVTVRDFQGALEQLTQYTSRWITNELRDKLRDVRN